MEDIVKLLKIFYKLKEIEIDYPEGEIKEQLKTAEERINDAIYLLVEGKT